MKYHCDVCDRDFPKPHGLAIHTLRSRAHQAALLKLQSLDPLSVVSPMNGKVDDLKPRPSTKLAELVRKVKALATEVGGLHDLREVIVAISE
jgi:hypothetical protein